MENEEKATIFTTLLESGCCKRCVLRFLGDINANFSDPESYFKTLKGVKPNSEIEESEEILKKSKPNPCIVCLDLLQDSLIEQMLSSNLLQEACNYDSDTFVNYISFPKSVLIREHSMEIYMTRKFPEFYKDHNIIAINKTWSLSVKDKLAEKIKKKFDRNSKFLIQLSVSYELENDESSVMFKLDDSFKRMSKRDDLISRNAIGESLKNIDKEKFCKHVSVPPIISSKSVIFDAVACNHEPIYIAGRYCKYSRSLGQTPWVQDNIRIVDGSVQELIFQSLEKAFDCKEFTFSASGREDFNARMLGRGRPFFIKITDPKTTKLPNKTFRAIEEEIKKTKVVTVSLLQFIDKKHANVIKEGEQFKTKMYRALCTVDQPENLCEYLEKINKLSTLTLLQKTPVRVFHRRSFGDRTKQIYSIHAEAIKGKENLFSLDVETQAGTYVKEFVHGDLGRTKPSLGKIIGGRVDIIALDVLDIKLDFPPEIVD